MVLFFHISFIFFKLLRSCFFPYCSIGNVCFEVSSMLSRESGIAYILAIRLYYFFVKHSRLTGLVLFFQRTLLLFRVREFIPEYFISLVSVCVEFSLFLVDLFVDSHSLSLLFVLCIHSSFRLEREYLLFLCLTLCTCIGPPPPPSLCISCCEAHVALDIS